MFKINNEDNSFCSGVDSVEPRAFSRHLPVQSSNIDTRITCKTYSKLTRKAADRYLVSLMLTLNIYYTLF